MPILLWAMAGISFCGFLVSLGLLLNQHLFGWAIATACFLSLNAIIYFLISASLYFSLRTARKEKTSSTKKLLQRLMIWTLVNGFIFTFAGIASVVLFVVRLDSVLWVGALSASQQFFSVSFLASLNARKSLLKIANTNTEDTAIKPISVINFARATRSSSDSQLSSRRS
ncbi:hypothetical protein PTI98_003444 [Pleurotus ostreatus]|nr:hypothetical protein PTI98_003444 [Pleurotus ostreatus]